MTTVTIELPRGWRQIDAAGCHYLAFHAGSLPFPADEVPSLLGDAVPVTVNGLDILDSLTRELGSLRRSAADTPSTILAVEYPAGDLLAGVDGLNVIEESSCTMAGRPAWRMDVTYRHGGMAMFTRRWIIDAGPTMLEIAATCALDHFGTYIGEFDALEERIALAA